MGGLSWWHWLIIGGAFVVLFGAKRLPDAARGVGRSLRILKSEVSAMHEDEAAGEVGPASGAAPAAGTPVAAAPLTVASTPVPAAPEPAAGPVAAPAPR
ncbi:Sec-independent protein translocase subunit TatA [Nakamurella multipartita]|uniref:Sec-independent protein translocase protein TatA n=1 Tax=Nakamurella multipartita (strain ATCC 700099 / DSM 44233 / CIP 104796 / JCM 9543 / NBRC 105858 / Y-104) TaxID=479431 RepID=C8XGV6_NAKMY|nr:Sec-independent protein translocase subunit TatA [Nakamurella multipartita]ACV80187.1 twin-arginine translocation protein, TatA/E family subunit [Nakamurella multipartita DSM 44233]